MDFFKTHHVLKPGLNANLSCSQAKTMLKDIGDEFGLVFTPSYCSNNQINRGNFFFVHTPKTAGTALIKPIHRNLIFLKNVLGMR